MPISNFLIAPSAPSVVTCALLSSVCLQTLVSLIQDRSSFLTSPPITPAATHSPPATQVFLLFLKHPRPALASGHLHCCSLCWNALSPAPPWLPLLLPGGPCLPLTSSERPFPSQQCLKRHPITQLHLSSKYSSLPMLSVVYPTSNNKCSKK